MKKIVIIGSMVLMLFGLTSVTTVNAKKSSAPLVGNFSSNGPYHYGPWQLYSMRPTFGFTTRCYFKREQLDFYDEPTGQVERTYSEMMRGGPFCSIPSK